MYLCTRKIRYSGYKHIKLNYTHTPGRNECTISNQRRHLALHRGALLQLKLLSTVCNYYEEYFVTMSTMYNKYITRDILMLINRVP